MTDEMRNNQPQSEPVEPAITTDELSDADLNEVAGGLNFTKITYNQPNQTQISDGTSNTIMFAEKLN